MSDNDGLGWPFQAMTFKTGTRELLETAAADPVVAFEQKLDGTRCMILVDSSGNGPQIVQRNGAPLKHSASLPTAAKVLASLPDTRQLGPRFGSGYRFILDGELMWSEGCFVAFDLPSITAPGNTLFSPVTPQVPFGLRRSRLEHLHEWMLRDSEVRLVAHERTEAGKRELVTRIQDMNGEGVLVKRVDAPYSIGTRVSHSLKVKFTKTCDVIVTSYEFGRNAEGNQAGSIGFGVLHDNVPGFDATLGFAMQGSCSAIGRPAVKLGDVIEVEYLAFQGDPKRGGGIREPRMVRVREDKTPADCRMGQFREHSRVVL